MPTSQLEPGKSANFPSKSSMLFKAIKQENASQRNKVMGFGKKKTMDVSSTFGLIEKDVTSFDTPRANQITCHKFIDLT